MDSDTEVERIFNRGGVDIDRPERPPSSYGSMRSDDEEEEDEDVADGSTSKAVTLSTNRVTRLRLLHSASLETQNTGTSQPLNPAEACVIYTGFGEPARFELDHEEEEVEEDEIEDEDDENLIATTPIPSSPVELENQMRSEEDESRTGRLHPELDMPYVFMNMQSVLSELPGDTMTNFKIRLCRDERELNLRQLLDEDDVLNLVDKMIEVLGHENALKRTISLLQLLRKVEEAALLEDRCKRVLICFDLKQSLIRKHKVLFEGVPRQGKNHPLDTVYVEPQISACGRGGVDPDHELRPATPSLPPLPDADSFVGVSDLFHLRKGDGEAVRTVVTTGIPGIGMSVVAAKFCLDWAEGRTCKDLQFVISLSFQSLWSLRNLEALSSKEMSIAGLIKYFYRECRDMKYLEEPQCRILFVMDSFDYYQAALDWERAPVLSDVSTPAHLDVLVINLIRGTLVPAAQIWLLGRRAAISKIPPAHIDAVTEIQGFSDEMKDEYLSRRFQDKGLAARIVAHYKRTPSLRILCRQPFVCWMAASMFQRCFNHTDYGECPPRLTPFYIHTMVIQTNRKLQRCHGLMENQVKWSDRDRYVLKSMGKMALTMVEQNTCVFFEETLEEHGLGVDEVAVYSGLCTELPTSATNERKGFCFIHLTVQEFMAAVYIFMIFCQEGRTVLYQPVWRWLPLPKLPTPQGEPRSLLELFRSAVGRTLESPTGHMDMVLRFLCGLFYRGKHNEMLGAKLFGHPIPPLSGVKEVQKLMERTIKDLSTSSPTERLVNLKECLRELIQEDE